MKKRAIQSDAPESTLLGSISHAGRALRHRNFKLFFAGQSISVMGTWMTRLALLLFALLSLMGYSYAVLLPVFASQVLHGGASTLGWLTGASGIGAVASTLSLAVRKSVERAGGNFRLTRKWVGLSGSERQPYN